MLMTMIEPAELEIRFNYLAFRGTCPTCKTKYHPEIGPALYVVDGADVPLCSDCTAQQSAGVLELLRRARRDSRAA